MRRALLALTLLILPLSLSAHTSGIFYEAWVDGVHIDIGYSSAAPAVGESVIFDLNIGADQQDAIKYTDVWVRIESKDGVTLATAVHNAEFGGPRMSYVFPKEGDYTVSVRYENEGTALAKAEFPLKVVPAAKQGIDTVPWFAFLAGGLLIGGAAGFFLRLKKKG